MPPRSPTGDRIHAGAMFVVAALGYIGWTVYFSTGLFVNREDPFWNRFENAFVLADVTMCTAFLVAGVLLLRRNVFAVPVGIAAAGAMVFLLCLDFLFDVQSGQYASLGPVTALEIAINLICLSFGPFTIIRLWRRRHALEGSEDSP